MIIIAVVIHILVIIIIAIRMNNLIAIATYMLYQNIHSETGIAYASKEAPPTEEFSGSDSAPESSRVGPW